MKALINDTQYRLLFISDTHARPTL